jgi:outer membrane protein W
VECEYEPNSSNLEMKSIVLCLILILGLGAAARAQLSFDANVGYILPADQGSGGAWGGGIGAKYYLQPKITVGLRVRGYVDHIKQQGNGLTGQLTAVTIPVMGTFVYQITTNDLHPYVGLEAGLIRNAVTSDLSFNGQRIYDDVIIDNTFGIAPKAGVGYDLTQGLTVSAEAIYTVGFGKNQAGNMEYNFNQSARFLTAHVGISFTFGNRFDHNRLISQ